MSAVDRWHLWYTDIKRSSVVSWQTESAAREYGQSRHGVPIPCGTSRDTCVRTV